jgi:single-stranded DNA-specific DHH superfamily exonuclease
MCQKYHTEQVNKVKKFIEHHQDEIDAQADSNITIIDAKDVPQAFSGLIAGKISDITNKPCIVGKTVNGELGGSFRGYIPKNVMATLPHVNKAAGHDVGAYGIFIDTSKSQNLDDLRAEIDKMDISTIPIVTASFSANKLQMGIFNEFVGHDDLWGKELDKPRFYIYNIKVNSKDIRLMGKKQDTIKINLDGYEIMFFKLSMEQVEKFKSGVNKELNINLIGTLNINKWQGRKTNQICVEDFEVQEVTNTFEDLM